MIKLRSLSSLLIILVFLSVGIVFLLFSYNADFRVPNEPGTAELDRPNPAPPPSTADASRLVVSAEAKKEVRPELPEVSPVGDLHFRIVSGRVLDRDGSALSKGFVTIQHPLRHILGRTHDVQISISPKGYFEQKLSAEDFAFDNVLITVHDGFCYVFQGVVAVAEGIEVRVESSRLTKNLITGLVHLSAATPEDHWITLLTAVNEPRKGDALANSEPFGNCSGQMGEITLSLSPWDSKYAGEVELTAILTGERSGRGGMIAQQRFESLDSLKRELHVGLMMEAYIRHLKLEDIKERPVHRLGLRSVEFRIITSYPLKKLARNEFSISVPPGRYVIKAANDAGQFGVAEVLFGEESERHIAWTYIIPGEYSIAVRITDQNGIPSGGARLNYRKREVEESRLVYGTRDADEHGVVLLKGLVQGDYDISCRDKSGKARASTVIHLNDTKSQTVEVTLSPRPSAAIMIGLRNGLNVGVNVVNTTTTKVWYRRDDEVKWTRFNGRVDSGGEYGWVITGLAEDARYQIAILGEWWGGDGFLQTDNGLKHVEIPVRLLTSLKGSLSFQGAAAKQCTIAWAQTEEMLGGSSGMPWETTMTAKEFDLHGEEFGGVVGVLVDGEVVVAVPASDFYGGPREVRLK